MAVTISSSSTSNVVQADGRKSVLEAFNLSDGTTRFRAWLAEASVDLAAALTTHGAELLVVEANLEMTRNLVLVETLGSLATITLNFSTASQNAALARAAYKVATQTQAAMLGDFVNTLTDAQIANAFGITTGQAATLRTNVLQPAATLAASIRAAVGQ